MLVLNNEEYMQVHTEAFFFLLLTEYLAAVTWDILL